MSMLRMMRQIRLFFLLLFLAFTSPVYADGLVDNMLTANGYPNDVSMALLKTMFSGLPIFSGADDGFQHVFMIFNALCLTIGGIMAGYTLLLSMSGTASHGQALGKQNATWMPIRTVFGVVMILPFFNGYALVNVMVMYLVVQGIGGANKLWDAFVSSEVLKSSLAVSPVQPETKELARNILVASMCMSAIQESLGDSVNMGWSFGYGDNTTPINLTAGTGAKGPVSYKTSQPLMEVAKANPDQKLRLRAGNIAGGNGIADNECGELVLDSVMDGAGDHTYNSERRHSQMATAAIGATTMWRSESKWAKIGGFAATMFGVASLASDEISEYRKFKDWARSMNTEHIAATQKMVTDARAITDAIVKSEVHDLNHEENQRRLKKAALEGEENPELLDENEVAIDKAGIAKAIDQLASNYQRQFRAQAAATYNGDVSYDTLVKNAHEYGWMMAGTFFVQMSSMTDNINRIALNTPSATSVKTIRQDNIRLKNVHSELMSKLNKYFDMTESYKNDGFQVTKTDVNTKASEKDLAAQAGKTFSLTSMLNGLTQNGLNMAISDQEHPIMQLKRLGSLMMSIASVILSFLVTSSGEATNTTTGLVISIVAVTLMTALFSGGITLNFILPMLPVFVWLGMVFGWLVMVIQAMIATSLWVVMHLSPHTGEDFVGQQRQGYMLTFSLVIRPILMVFGYIAALMSMTIIGFFINALFIFIYNMSQASDIGFLSAVLSLVIVPLLYAGMVYAALKEMIKIMHKVPDEILSWIGGGGPQLGGYAESMNSGSTQIVGGLINQASRPMDRVQGDIAANAAKIKQAEHNEATKLRGNHNDGQSAQTAIQSGTSEDNGYDTNLGADGEGKWMGATGYARDADGNFIKTGNGIFDGSSEDIRAAKSKIHNVPSEMMDDAVVRAVDAFEQAKQRNPAVFSKPLSNSALVNGMQMEGADFTDFGFEKGYVPGVNDFIRRSVAGKQFPELRQKMVTADRYTQKPENSRRMWNNFINKSSHVADRVGIGLDQAGEAVAGSINKAMDDYSQNHLNKPFVTALYEPSENSGPINGRPREREDKINTNHIGTMMKGVNEYLSRDSEKSEVCGLNSNGEIGIMENEKLQFKDAKGNTYTS